jgi:hypothetical protein
MRDTYDVSSHAGTGSMRTGGASAGAGWRWLRGNDNIGNGGNGEGDDAADCCGESDALSDLRLDATGNRAGSGQMRT